MSGLKEKRSVGHAKSVGPGHQNGDISAGPWPGLRKKGGQRRAHGRRGRGTPSLTARRASRPRPSRLHLPRRPQVTPRRGRLRGIPRGESGTNPGLLSPRTARGSRGHRAAAVAAVTGSSPAETAWALTRDFTPLRRAMRMRKAKRVWRAHRWLQGWSSGCAGSARRVLRAEGWCRGVRGLRKGSRCVTSPCPNTTSPPSFLLPSPRLWAHARFTSSLRPCRRGGGARRPHHRAGFLCLLPESSVPQVYPRKRR